ncbi:hypothetical protein OMR07_10945, partial [Methylobacterium organophilum]|nr:hypothetical protein [Methylobacterium organophilum]
RGYTGRDAIIKFEGCYHGHSDSLLVKAGSGALTQGVPSSAGVRGGISVALALSIPESEAKPAILAATYAVVLFTIIVQGSTLGLVARRTLRAG